VLTVEDSPLENFEIVECGSFGEILSLSDGGGCFVGKRIKLSSSSQNPHKLGCTSYSQVIIECAFAKVCSMLAVGPKF
jgi:hypothetical protein